MAQVNAYKARRVHHNIELHKKRRRETLGQKWLRIVAIAEAAELDYELKQKEALKEYHRRDAELVAKLNKIHSGPPIKPIWWRRFLSNPFWVKNW